MNADLVIDCIGVRCPTPVIRLAKRLGEVEVGQTLAVVADDPAAAVDIPAWCRLREQEYVGVSDTDATPTYLVRRLS
ncbi:MAG: sulfurtransferase TusA family protein [Nocardioidaceae bacterium]